MQDYLKASLVKLKTNMSRYIRVLESGRVKGVIVYRGDERVALLIPIKQRNPEDNSEQCLQAPPRS